MNFGFTGVILRINLSNEKIEKIQLDNSFYRKYMGGGTIGSYFLLHETKPDTDPFSEENIITIAPGVTTGAPVSGASRCCVTSLSPLTNLVGDSQAGGSIGPMIKRAGYDAIVIKGKSPKLSYLLIENENIKIINADFLSGKTISEVHDILFEKFGKRNLSVLQCGPAGEKMVRYANLMSDLHDSFGRNGLGAVFGSKNLRAIVVRGDNEIPFAEPENLKKLNKLAHSRLPNSGFPTTLHKYGTPGVLAFQTESGNLATHNYSRSFHENYKNLDGATFLPSIGAGQTSCYGCIVGCRKKVRTESPYKVTDKLGGPEFETLGLLGSNLDITDPVAVAKANELCNEYGLDTINVGGIAGYLFECMEKGLIKPNMIEGKELKFGDPESLFWIIEKIVSRKGIGDILAEGFESMIKYFGENTRDYAICVKGQGLAVHMPQVKPSQALMYAVCPIGPDHMSCEHDWLLASNSEDTKALGIIGSGDTKSTNLSKVRMVVYSQYFYSLLDTLSLCMFCWGPGNLFTYRELEDLVNFTTGWRVSLWELMKVGERRVNMMRHINARRGFTKEHDTLPKRLFEPLPDGFSKGRHVDEQSFKRMLNEYYALMGWDELGNPSYGKLLELGLDWEIENELVDRR